MSLDDALLSPPEGTAGSNRDAFLSYASRDGEVALRVCALLESAGISFDSPSGEGIFLWGRVPESSPVEALVRRAREHSILLARGSLFSAAGGCGQWLRFNVAHSNSPRLVQFLHESLRAA